MSKRVTRLRGPAQRQSAWAAQFVLNNVDVVASRSKTMSDLADLGVDF